MLNIKTEKYKHYGNVLAVTNGAVDLKITLDVGPRVIYFALPGGENVMFNKPNEDDAKIDPRFEAAFGKGSHWNAYGGHRIWQSPEDFPLSYNPDDKPVDYRLDGDTLVFTQALQDTTELQFIMEITLDKRKPIVTVNNRIVNHSGGIRTIAPWALTMMAPGGVEVIPQPAENYSLLSNREIVLWPYSDMTDRRVYWGKNFITLKCDQTAEGSFKLGLNNTAGVAAYINNGTAFIKRYEHDMHGNYPDRGVSFETYTCPTFIEIETLGVLKDLMPEEATEHKEVWRLARMSRVPSPKNETTLSKAAEKLFK